MKKQGSFPQVAKETARQIAKMVDHPDCPEELSAALGSAINEYFNENNKGERIGEGIKRQFEILFG